MTTNTKKLAVVLTRSEDHPSGASVAEMLGFEVVIPRVSTVDAVLRRMPDIIFIDWAPGEVKENTELVLSIRATSVLRRTPIVLFHSFQGDVSKELLATDRLVAFEMPTPFATIQRAARQCFGDVLPVAEPANSQVAEPGRTQPKVVTNKSIFIGHGRAYDWKDLSTFLSDRLGLRCEEFNSQPTAGIPTAARLEQMLNMASFAFLVMTAEDAHGDGSVHARENVIHEVGLFQGKLGFRRAIVLLEEGCQEFSNIDGLGQIRFSRGQILAKSEEIRAVLEREGIIAAQGRS